MNTLAVMKEINPDRSKYLGGSDAASILGVSPWKSALQLYQEKIGEYQEEITPAKQKIFNRGIRWEPVVCDMLMDELQDRGHDVKIIGRNNRYLDHEHSFMAAEIDLELVIDGKIINGEIKTVSPFAAKHWGEQGTDEIPLGYVAQVLHGQMVTGINQTVVAALIGADDLRIHFIDRDDEMITYIRDREIAFWHMVQTRTPPPIVTAKDINRLYQIDSGASIEADEELLNWYAQLASLKQEVEQREAQIEVLSTDIKRRMGETALLTHNGYKLISWKSNRNSSKTDWKRAFYALAKDYAENAQDDIDAYIRTCTTTKPGARPFLVKV
jgi:putative phage-type endonuclease